MSANSPRAREYLITINQGAKCYDEVEEIIKNKCNYSIYALITHDKDESIDDNGETHIKQAHKHAVVELKNAVSFNSMQSRFEGAHIEPMKYRKSAYQYLIHNTPNSKEKYRYSLDDIITNNRDEIEVIINSEWLEPFVDSLIPKYIAQGTTTLYGFFKRFGNEVYNKYRFIYFDLVNQWQQGIDPQLNIDVKEWQEIIKKTGDF